MPHVHTFAGGWFDRCGNQRRNPEWLAARLAAPESRFLPLWQLRALMSVRDGLTLGWRTRAEVERFLAEGRTAVFLGLHEGIAHFAIDCSGAGESQPFREFGKFIDARSAAMQCPAADAAVLSQARSLIDWHARHRFCANCGAPTEPKEAGYMRLCGACGAQHFPRTDPVTIMLVLRGDKVLLGRQPRFAPLTYSALAGFVEPGESIEEAVRREVREEVGIRVGAVRYHSSQPWPFPSSLMIGCMAEAEEEEIRLDPEELEDARWFSRDEVARMVENHKTEGELRMPPPLSIAHQLARAWLRGE